MGSLLGALGAVAIVFGMVGVVLQFLSGGLFWSVDQPWIWANFGIGVLLIGVWLAGNLDDLRERMRSGEARRAGKYGTSAVLGTLLAVALLALLAFLATRYHKRWDWTEASTHSLSDQTRKLLEGLTQDVQVTALYTAVSAARARDLLERYEYVSERFKVTYADPQAQPGLVRTLGIAESKLSGGVVHVALGGESVDVEELSEENLTNAIVKLSRRERKKVYFLEGHEERPPDGEGADGNEGFAFAAGALKDENYEWARLLLATQPDVPEDANVVVIAGPTRPFHDTELEALRRYVKRGGALLVLIDPRANTNLAADLEAWGVALGDDVVVDRVQGLFGRPVSPFAAEYGKHPITEGLREATLFHVARSVQARSEADGAFTALASTGPDSWAERDVAQLFSAGRAELGEGDLRGPVPVAVAGTLAALPEGSEAGAEPAEDAPRARLVVVGDSDFATNQLVREFRNRDLFVNAVNWLLGDVEAISIRPAESRASRMRLSQEQFIQLRYLALFVLPEAIAALGVFAWWSRRRAPGR